MAPCAPSTCLSFSTAGRQAGRGRAGFTLNPCQGAAKHCATCISQLVPSGEWREGRLPTDMKPVLCYCTTGGRNAKTASQAQTGRTRLAPAVAIQRSDSIAHQRTTMTTGPCCMQYRSALHPASIRPSSQRLQPTQGSSEQRGVRRWLGSGSLPLAWKEGCVGVPSR